MTLSTQFRQTSRRASAPPSEDVSIEDAVGRFRQDRTLASVRTHYGVLLRDGLLVDHAGRRQRVF